MHVYQRWWLTAPGIGVAVGLCFIGLLAAGFLEDASLLHRASAPAEVGAAPLLAMGSHLLP
ncbi:hypothetical protein [Pseudomonas sp. B1-22]|uniref:hypothetical protein n=1 Tax=Pseudomonas sp. B1-22 TaxID=3141456 RepID=UPI003D2CEAF6